MTPNQMRKARFPEDYHPDCTTCGKPDVECECVMCGSCNEVTPATEPYDHDLEMCGKCMKAEGVMK